MDGLGFVMLIQKTDTPKHQPQIQIKIQIEIFSSSSRSSSNRECG
jgi:hypothetical protein